MYQTSLRTHQLRLAKILRHCAKNSLLNIGMQAHAAVTQMGFSSDVIISNDLIGMYSKCYRLDIARKVFDRMPQRNVVSWTSLICGYLYNGDVDGGLGVFGLMGVSGVKPNEYTFSSCFKACGVSGVVEKGMQVHCLCVKSGYERFSVVGNSLIDMYGKCGRVESAARVFDEMNWKDLIAWNSIVAGYASVGNGVKCMEVFMEMLDGGETPDEYTFTSVLKACGVVGDVDGGAQIHAALITRGFPVYERAELVGSLIDMYVKCGCLSDARVLFDHIEDRGVVSWASLVLGYAKEDNVSEAMNVFRQLRESKIQVDAFTLSGLIGVFADFALVEQGKQMQAYATKVPSSLEQQVANSIADMYLKCGLIDDAERIFSEMPVKDRVSYTVMVTGYGKHGLGEKAIEVFNEMLLDDIRPDSTTYLAILSACSHSGLIEECKYYFSRLCNDRLAQARVEHYSCVVDLLGRAGCLKEAKDIIDSMPMMPNIGVWQTLLSACRVHGNLELAKEIGQIILELDGDNAVNYVQVSNICATAGYWKECQELKETVTNKGLKKEAGWSVG